MYRTQNEQICQCLYTRAPWASASFNGAIATRPSGSAAPINAIDISVRHETLLCFIGFLSQTLLIQCLALAVDKDNESGTDREREEEQDEVDRYRVI
jgi:hypothetical protein